MRRRIADWLDTRPGKLVLFLLMMGGPWLLGQILGTPNTPSWDVCPTGFDSSCR